MVGISAMKIDEKEPFNESNIGTSHEILVQRNVTNMTK